MMAPVSRFFGYLGPALISCILLAGLFMILGPVFADTADLDAEVTIGNTFPTVSAVSVNNNSDIILTANATTAVSISFTVTDHNGCTDVFENGNTTSTGYRVSLDGACTADNLNCYRVATSTHDCESATSSSANATATLEIYYFADATDASSSYSGEYWEALVEVADSGGSTSSATSTGVELSTLVSATPTTSTINYGTLVPSSTTGFVNQITSIKNTGNASSGVLVSGTALIGATTEIATGSQHYASSSFFFSGTQLSLSGVNSTISGITLAPRINFINDIGSWIETEPINRSPRFAGYASTPHHIYVAGGQTTTTVNYAAINSDGTLGAWAETTVLDQARYLNSSVAYNNYLYVVAGTGLFSDTAFAPINSGGDVGSWSTTNAPPVSGDYSNFPTVANNGYIYTLGGIDGVSIIATVYYSTFNTDGTISSWLTTTALPSAVYDSAAVIHSGYIYVLGGADSLDIATSAVNYAVINSNGTLGSWTQTAALPGAMSLLSATALNGYIYVLGTGTTSVFYAEINSSGGINSWSNATAMPDSLNALGAISNNGYLYRIPDDSSTSSVFYSNINNGRTQKDIFWGIELVGTFPQGTHVGTTTFSGDFKE